MKLYFLRTKFVFPLILHLFFIFTYSSYLFLFFFSIKYLVEPKCRPLTGSGEHDYLLSGEYYDLEVNDVIFVKHGFGIAHGTLTCTNYRLRFTSHLDKPFYVCIFFYSLFLSLYKF